MEALEQAHIAADTDAVEQAVISQVKHNGWRCCAALPEHCLLLLVLQAADKLSAGSPVAGQVFFITNQDPVPFWEFTGDLLSGLGYPRPHIRLPYLPILLIAMLFEYVIRPLLKPFKELSTDFTVFRVRLVTRQRAFSADKARRLLGYVPKVPLKEGIKRTVAQFEHLRADKAKAS